MVTFGCSGTTFNNLFLKKYSKCCQMIAISGLKKGNAPNTWQTKVGLI